MVGRVPDGLEGVQTLCTSTGRWVAVTNQNAGPFLGKWGSPWASSPCFVQHRVDEQKLRRHYCTSASLCVVDTHPGARHDPMYPPAYSAQHTTWRHWHLCNSVCRNYSMLTQGSLDDHLQHRTATPVMVPAYLQTSRRPNAKLPGAKCGMI